MLSAAPALVVLAFLGACGARASLDVGAYGEPDQADAGRLDGQVADGPAGDGDPDALVDADADAAPPRECPNDSIEPAILANDPLLSDIAVDQTDVYWANLAGAIKKTPRCGGPVTVLVEKGAPGRNRMALSSSDVYWARGDSIGRISKNGGVVGTFANTTGWNLVADDTSLYVYADNGLSRFPLDGSPSTLVEAVPPTPSRISTRANNVVMGANGVYIARHLFPKGVEIAGVTKLAATGEALFADATLITASGIAVDDRFIYYAGSVSGSTTKSWGLFRVPLSGGTQKTITSLTVSPITSWVDELVADDHYVYWVGQIEARTRLRRVSKKDGTFDELLTKTYPTFDPKESVVAIDDVYLYVALGDGELLRKKK